MPAFLGVSIPSYTGYKAEVAPGITHAFAVAAFRFGHTLVPPAILLRNRNCKYGRAPGGHDAIRLCQTWWDGNVRNFPNQLRKKLPILVFFHLSICIFN